MELRDVKKGVFLILLLLTTEYGQRNQQKKHQILK